MTARDVMPGQSIEYNVMAAIEAGCHQVHNIQGHLIRRGCSYYSTQISGALQRLKKDKVVEFVGFWQIKNKPPKIGI